MKKYLITPTLLNSWKYCIENGDLDKFIETLRKTEFVPNESIIKGNEFEEYMVKNYPDTKNGCYQVKVYKEIIINGIKYIIYGKTDCLKAGVITDYKYTGTYDVGKFYGSYQTAVYMEVIEEAYKMQYIISDNFDKNKLTDNWEEDKEKFNLYKEEYYRNELKIDLSEEINTFMKWLERFNLLKLFQEKWESKY